MQNWDFELSKLSTEAIKSLHDVLANPDDYNTILSIVKNSPVSVENSPNNMNIRINTVDELKDLKYKLSKIIDKQAGICS